MLRHEGRSAEALRIHPDSATSSAAGDAIPADAAATAASFTYDDSAASDPVANAGDSETQAFANAGSDSDCDIDPASRRKRRRDASSDSETARQSNAHCVARN